MERLDLLLFFSGAKHGKLLSLIHICLGFHQAATLLASCRNGLLYVPLILLLPGLLGLSGVAMSQPAADLLTFLVSIPFQLWFFRHKLRG